MTIRLPVAAAAAVLLGCATAGEYVQPEVRPIPSADQILAPQPRPDTDGKYLSPFTSEGVVAKWVDDGMKAKLAGTAGAAVGGAVGQIAGAQIGGQVLSQLGVPGGALLGNLLGGMIGQAAGDSLGEEAGKAIALAGGAEKMKQTSDISFDSPGAMAIWMYANFSHTEHYAQVLEFASVVYPELKQGYDGALRSAQIRPAPSATPTALAAASPQTSGVTRLGLVKGLAGAAPQTGGVTKLGLVKLGGAEPEVPAAGGIQRLGLIQMGATATSAAAAAADAGQQAAPVDTSSGAVPKLNLIKIASEPAPKPTRVSGADLMDGVPPPVMRKPAAPATTTAPGAVAATETAPAAGAPAAEIPRLSIIPLQSSGPQIASEPTP